MRLSITAILCSLILGLSIGIGSSIAGPKAETSGNAAIVSQLKRTNDKLTAIKYDTQSIETLNGQIRNTVGPRFSELGQDDIRDLVKKICDSTRQFGGC